MLIIIELLRYLLLFPNCLKVLLLTSILVYLMLINTSLGSSQAIQLAYVLVFLSEQ